jgi:hypothetical protein
VTVWAYERDPVTWPSAEHHLGSHSCSSGFAMGAIKSGNVRRHKSIPWFLILLIIIDCFAPVSQAEGAKND